MSNALVLTSQTSQQFNPATPAWHEDLLARLGYVRARVKRAFASLNPTEQDEAIADVTADVACELAKLAEQGRAHQRLVRPLLLFGIRRRRAGRRVGIAVNRYDLLSPVPRNECLPRSLEAEGTNHDGISWRNAVVDNTRSDPAEAAVFRIDFAAWLSGLPQKHRQVAEALAFGERPSDVAEELGLSRGRVSQIRNELAAGWQEFVGEAA